MSDAHPGAAGAGAPAASLYRVVDTHADLQAELLLIALKAGAAAQAVSWVVLIPFLVVNKPASALVTGIDGVFMCAIPWMLLRSGHPVAAARLFLGFGALTGTLLALFARLNVNGAGVAFQMAVVGLAMILLGRRTVFWIAIPCLAADLAGAILEEIGRPLPVIFPGSPRAFWVAIFLTFLLAILPLNRTIQVLRDLVSLRREESESRRRSEDQILYQAQLIDQAADPVMAADNNRTVTYWNLAAERLLGWSRAEALGKRVDQLTPLAPTSVPRGQVQRELDQTGQFKGEVAMLTRSGSTVIVEAVLTRIRDAAGGPMGTVAGLRDITARREAEHALKRSEERQRLIATTAPVGIVVLDNDRRIAFTNPFAERVFGMSPVGRRFDEMPELQITDWDGKPLGIEEWPSRRAINGQTVSDVRLAITVASGRRVYATVNANPIVGSNGTVEGVIATFDDYTARREIEQRYLRAQKMEDLGRLAGGVVHDFNNLLMVINGFSAILLRDPALPAPIRSTVQRIAEAGDSANALCRQLLAFSRRQITEPVAVAANNAVAEVAQILRSVLGGSVALITRLDPQTGHVMAGAGQVQQCLMNLAVNARDAMPQGGTLTIVTANRECVPDDAPAGAAAGSFVEFSVEDTGAGMDERTQQRAFEPFFTTKPVGKGTGLGLSTVYGIVRQNGGWIRLTSHLGKGTCISMFFPRTAPPPVAAGPSAEVSDTARGERILVVEDQSEVRAFLGDCLKSFGYAVTEAASGAEALPLLERNGIDLVVTDMIMPVMGGAELIAAIERRWPAIPVLALSGYAGEVAAAPRTLKRIAALSKPVSPTVLAEAVRKLLDDPAIPSGSAAASPVPATGPN